MLWGGASRKLRLNFKKFAELLANEHPRWVDYHVLMFGGIIGLEEHPGVKPLGVGETWQRLLLKCVLKVAGEEVKEACVTDQLNGGV